MTMNAVDAPIPYDSDGSETTVDMVPTLHLGSIYPPSSDYTQNGPDSEQKCASDPVVQALVARLNAGSRQIPIYRLSELALSLRHLHGDTRLPHNWLVGIRKCIWKLSGLFGLRCLPSYLIGMDDALSSLFLYSVSS